MGSVLISMEDPWSFIASQAFLRGVLALRVDCDMKTIKVSEEAIFDNMIADTGSYADDE